MLWPYIFYVVKFFLQKLINHFKMVLSKQALTLAKSIYLTMLWFSHRSQLKSCTSSIKL